MAYAIDTTKSAQRHLSAADVLYDNNTRRDVSGYLYGVAAECAVKALMGELGFRSTPGRQDNPYYAHFPELRSMLRNSLTGRRSAVLLRFISDDKFMSQWSTDMRYSHGRDIKAKWIEAWRDQARQIVASIGT